MLESARVLDAREKVDLCDIAAIPMCQPKYYEDLRGVFQRKAYSSFDPPVFREPDPVYEGEDAKNLMIGIFSGSRV